MAKALLVIGIHREELAFGEAVASGIDRALFDVLTIPEGLSGQRPRPDQRFRFDAMHVALYRQLLPYVKGRYPLLVDLHTGVNETGFCMDLFCRDPAWLSTLLPPLSRQKPEVAVRVLRMIQPGEKCLDGEAVAETVIPGEIWRNPAFRYLGVEAFLSACGAGTTEEQDFTRQFLNQLIGLSGKTGAIV